MALCTWGDRGDCPSPEREGSLLWLNNTESFCKVQRCPGGGYHIQLFSLADLITLPIFQSLVSNSLSCHELQYARLPCPSLSQSLSDSCRLLMKVKEESKKVGLKLDIQKMKIMASGPITSWEIDGETTSDFFGGAPKSPHMVIAAMKLKDTCSLEGKL